MTAVNLDRNAGVAATQDAVDAYVAALAQPAAEVLAEARATVAAAIGAHADEIHFTSGGTEADARAVHGVVAGAAELPARSESSEPAATTGGP